MFWKKKLKLVRLQSKNADYQKMCERETAFPGQIIFIIETFPSVNERIG